MEFCHIGQIGLQLMDSNDHPASASSHPASASRVAGMTGEHHCVCLLTLLFGPLTEAGRGLRPWCTQGAYFTSRAERKANGTPGPHRVFTLARGARRMLGWDWLFPYPASTSTPCSFTLICFQMLEFQFGGNVWRSQTQQKWHSFWL